MGISEALVETLAARRIKSAAVAELVDRATAVRAQVEDYAEALKFVAIPHGERACGLKKSVVRILEWRGRQRAE